ncbi:deoxyribodipyrimidine photo-lyase [Candidatus Woesebacteria bacterium]|nr:deoxyribodipyrimidine photo-lyase [Candidatus Woesebacteria bacterium]MCD8526967.1 deoxyribodipyrimidine photo-lyase [Candidatus Woesebacteria bacterium]MCD8545862.1 deoxyribodipyrimidine photo-lyase [Candidatus Woesebacteria bacterium]
MPADTERSFLQKFIDPQHDSVPQEWSKKEGVVYWMLREHRAKQNRGLRLAQILAHEHNVPLTVVVAMRPDLDTHNIIERTLDFMLTGLEEVEATLQRKKIAFSFLIGDPTNEIPAFVKKHPTQLILTDLFPLPVYRQWYDDIKKKTGVPLIVVDGHNHIPVWITSEKREYAARTIRPKIWKHYKTFAKPVSNLEIQKQTLDLKAASWQTIRKKITAQKGYPPLEKPTGRQAARKALKQFVTDRLPHYADRRNDPAEAHTSQLSAYFHFGHLAATEVSAAIEEAKAPQKDKDAFLEEFVVRKELSDNFCYYTANPLSIQAAPEWAQTTLQEHKSDAREHTYRFQELLTAQTHDPAWNAAQNQLLQTGYMHGYMRMYWAKKILEWSKNAEKAIEIAIQINDLLELDGRDPNGYVGILWAIAGVHDRPWQERAVFGKIRYMNFEGLKRKFAIEDYTAQWETKSLSET